MRTLQEVKDSPKEILTANDIAPILHCDPYNINLAAKNYPEGLRFNTCVIGTRVIIPKAAFIRFMEGLQGVQE